MKKILFLMIIIITFSCGGGKTEITGADKYINTITGFTCEKATVTDNGYLVIAIDAESASGYDTLASQFLEEAKKEGVSGLKGVLIVDIKTRSLNKELLLAKE